MIDPAFVTRAVTVLQSGNIMQSRFAVYESHLSYILQFMCDFGLYGCGWIELNEVWQRGRDEETPGEQLFKMSPHFRESRMTLEVDVAAHQILNRRKLQAREVHHKLTVPAPLQPSEPLIISVRELWEDERRRRIARGLSPSPEIPIDPSESSRGAGGDWVAEARWWEEIRKRIEAEREEPILNSNQASWEKEIISTFDSVQALWERERRRPKRAKDPTQVPIPLLGTDPDEAGEDLNADWDQLDGAGEAHDVTADVDESMLSSQNLSQMVDKEEQQWTELMGEGRPFDNEDADDDYYDEEDDDIILPEDGPPPDLQHDAPLNGDVLEDPDLEMYFLFLTACSIY